jgi:hypothetical protein
MSAVALARPLLHARPIMRTSLVALSLLGFTGCVTAGAEDTSFLSEIKADRTADTAAGGTFVRFAHLAKAPAGDFFSRLAAAATSSARCCERWVSAMASSRPR